MGSEPFFYSPVDPEIHRNKYIITAFENHIVVVNL